MLLMTLNDIAQYCGVSRLELRRLVNNCILYSDCRVVEITPNIHLDMERGELRERFPNNDWRVVGNYLSKSA